MKNRYTKEKLRLSLAMLLLVLVALSSACNMSPNQKPKYATINDLPPTEPERIEAVLTSPPLVPPPIKRKHPAKVVVRLEVTEVVKEIADGVDYTFWTFGGTVPGSFIRIRQHDEVEFHLMNHPDSKNPHNIDLHAVTGPGGGANASFTAPGHETVFNFKALNPGLYVYHCATAPVGMHIANGMYGLILVEPEGGYPPVDKEYYVMQGDFYTKGKFGEAGLQPFDMEKAMDEIPTYVLFNGAVGALSGDNSITAKTGEKVRLYVGNGGPNLISSFHVIGEIFDKVYPEGGMNINTNVQTTLIPAGGSAIVDFKVDVPGSLIIVDHSLFRTFNKGALGMLNVEGPENPEVFAGQTSTSIYMPEGSNIQEMPDAGIPASSVAANFEQRIKAGKKVYTQNCQACHQAEGQGIKGAFPPLASSDYLNADINRSIAAVAHGLEGPIKVNGELYNSTMPKIRLTDEEIANVMTYILNNWDNIGGEVTPEQVLMVKKNFAH